MGDLRSLLAIAAPHRGMLALSSALTLCESAAMLGVPWAGGRLTEAILRGAGPEIGGILLVMLGLFALQALFQFVSGYILDATGDRIIADLRVRLYDHLQALPLGFYHRRRLGDTLALLSTDVYVIGGFISSTVITLLPLLVTAAGAVVMMIRIRADLALLVAVLIPLFYLLAKIAGRMLRPLSVRLQNEEAGAIAMAQENLALLAAIKTFTREPQESARYRGQIDLILSLSAKQRGIAVALGPLAQFIAAAGILLVLGLASSDLAAGWLSPAQLVSFLLYAQLLARPVASLANVYGHAQSVRGALLRLQQAMSERPEVREQAQTPLAAVRGDIELRSVSFAYEGRPLALDRLDLRIAAGETVAVVGPNGAGKSTLGHLLMRLYQPSEGQVLIDGIDISTVSLESLRRQIGVVPQHVLLFNATVRDNIAYGQPRPDQALIEAAARAARAHEFIVQLPQGYETVIGDHGVRLSGGQQQRVALARALLKDPPILILDEATAMFDPQGEAEFLHACHDTLRRRTVLLITHRPASLAAADRIIRLEGGQLRVNRTDF
jgi:subfamily B ATP-binding cassette protein MsbA